MKKEQQIQFNKKTQVYYRKEPIIYDETTYQRTNIIKHRLIFSLIGLLEFFASGILLYAKSELILIFQIYYIFGCILNIIVGFFIIVFAFNRMPLKVYSNGIIFPTQSWDEFLKKKDPFIPFNMILKIQKQKMGSLKVINVSLKNKKNDRTFGKYNIFNIDEFLSRCEKYVKIENVL